MGRSLPARVTAFAGLLASASMPDLGHGQGPAEADAEFDVVVSRTVMVPMRDGV